MERQEYLSACARLGRRALFERVCALSERLHGAYDQSVDGLPDTVEEEVMERADRLIEGGFTLLMEVFPDPEDEATNKAVVLGAVWLLFTEIREALGARLEEDEQDSRLRAA